MTDLKLTINLDKVLYYEIIENLKPEMEKAIKRLVNIKLQNIFNQYHKDNDLSKLAKKIMEELN